MEHEIACLRLCDGISQLLLNWPGPRLLAAHAAGRAKRDLAAAFQHAAGLPEDARWSNALESLERFLDLCDNSAVANPSAMCDLRTFVEENADLLSPYAELKRAS
jgi:hypothetical protein